MSSERMAAADAQLLWLSAKVPNDQFLVYVFDGTPDIPAGLEEVRRNAEGFQELRLRVCDDSPWRYPRWVSAEIGAEQFAVHQAIESGDWSACLDSVARLDQLDVTRMAWRVNIFPPAVVVVQVSHALGDGTRSAALAAALLGRRVPIPAVTPDRGNVLWRGIGAARAHRAMIRDTEAGSLEPPPAPRPSLSVNAHPTGMPVLRTLVLDRARLHRPTVTVAVANGSPLRAMAPP
jgi:hypothetical protein